MHTGGSLIAYGKAREYKSGNRFARRQVDVKGYQEKSGKDNAVFVVSNTKAQSSVGITTDGKKAPKELLNFLYD